MYQRILGLVLKCLVVGSFVFVVQGAGRVININRSSHFPGDDVQLDPSSSDRVIKLLPFESIKIVSSNLSMDVKYVLFQSHTQLNDIMMSYHDPGNGPRDIDIKLEEQVKGKNVGLVVYLKGMESEAGIYVKNTNHKSINVLVITSTHSAEDPVPGGCNMEFNVETSPFLRLNSNKLRNRIEWQQAAIGSVRYSSHHFDDHGSTIASVRSSSPLNSGHDYNLSNDHNPPRTNDRSVSGHRSHHSTVTSSETSYSTDTQSCDTSYNFVTYQTYAYYLRENDYTEQEYFRGIKLMSDPKMVLKYGKSRESMSPTKLSQNGKTKSLYLSYPGRGIIFSVLCFTVTSASILTADPISIIPLLGGHNYPVSANHMTARPTISSNIVSKIATLYTPPDIDSQSVTSRSVAYVPIATYNCELNQGIETCGKLSGIWNVLFVSFLAISGLVLCLRGHQWFDFQAVWTSFLFTAILSFILITKYGHFTPFERDILVMISSIAFSCLWLFLWKLIGSPILTLLTSGLLLGFLVTASVLFTTLGNDDIFRNDLNYWLIMGCGSAIIPIALIPFAVLMSVFSSSIVGSYSVIFTIDRFVGGSISFIIINVFKRAIYSHDVDNELYQALNDVPLQGKDVILLITWFVLSLVGMCLQVYSSLDQPPFPSNNKSCCRPRVVDLNTVTVASYPVDSRGRRRSGHRRRRSRSRSIGSGRVRSRSTRRNAQATVTDPTTSNIVGSGSSQVVIVRPSAPPTEAAEEIRPLLCDPEPIHGYRSLAADQSILPRN